MVTADFVIGGNNLGSMAFHTRSLPGLPVDGMIGADFFRRRAVYLDFANHTAWISPARSR